MGIRADGTGGTGAVSVSLSDSAATQNAMAGLTVVTAGGGATAMDVIRSVSANTGGEGLKVSGATATLRIGYSSVTGNATGVGIGAGATVTSMGNNLIEDNTSPGSSIPVVAPL